MNYFRTAAILGGILFATAAGAAGGEPDWPCIQRKVTHLSAGAMWPQAAARAAGAPAELSGELADFAEVIALRRVSLEEVEARAAEVAQTHPEMSSSDWGAAFLTAFDRLDRRRTAVVAGISRYARNQTALAERIETLRRDMDAALDADAPDHDRIDAMEEELDWSLRVFDDRRRTLTYVCETPKVIEQRIYALAQILKSRAGE